LRETASPDLPLNLGDALLNLGDALPFGTTHPTSGISSSSVKSRAIAPNDDRAAFYRIGIRES
jgi:hypothetical protein